ncbi:MlaD family protein [Nocardia sp. NPDC059246]|uniref:MlaD family protein n=1 Tax=unclassified Nocardia TaxID=2637762 RepID=UPI0036BE3AC1
MNHSTRLRAGLGAIFLCGTVLVTTSCSLGPNDLPSVRGGVDNGYNITLQFGSVMNLPAGADVMMNGLQVGEVKAVDVAGQAVTVTAELKSGTRVPADIRAVIRQNTLLGDTYIALDQDPNHPATGFLDPGGTVPASRTTSPPQLEDTMAVLAYFVNGGSIQKVEDAMGRINSVMPAMQDVRQLATVVSTDLRDLSQHTGEIDRMLNGFDATAVAIDGKSSLLSTMFTDDSTHSGTYFWRRWAVSIVSYVSLVLPSIGSIFEGGLWMVPMLDSLASAGGTLRALWDDGPATTDKLSTFLRATLLPFVQHPSVNIRSVEAPQGDQLIGDVENVLRMLGAVK